ncbi:MAG: THUMP domain-containing protein [Vicingaceae bacterium]
MKLDKKTKYACVAKTLKGMEQPLLKELTELGYSNLRTRKRAVEFEADLEGIYRANLELRTALSVLVNIAMFNFKDDKDIYNEVSRIAKVLRGLKISPHAMRETSL